MSAGKTDGRRSWMDWYFFGWHPAEALGAVRFYFGLLLPFYLMVQFVQVLTLDPFGAHFSFTRPIWYFSLLGIDTHLPWLPFLVVPILVAACLFFAFGKWTKAAIIVMILCIFYLKGARDSFSGDVHHREVPIIAILILFLVSKCDRMFGIDARSKKAATDRRLGSQLAASRDADLYRHVLFLGADRQAPAVRAFIGSPAAAVSRTS